MNATRTRILKRAALMAAIAVAIVAAVITACSVTVTRTAAGLTFDRVADMPCCRAGLLLGTSPVTPQGLVNRSFINRMDAAASLYHAGKIKSIIVSGGDYRGAERYGCDEPRSMRDSLMARGVPDSVITLDYEGRRTINSIIKAKEVYGLDTVALISQKYHNERAIYQARHYGLHAVGLNAAQPRSAWVRFRNGARECLARVKLFLDLAIGGGS